MLSGASDGAHNSEQTPLERYLEWTAVIILSITTVLTAWTAFQSTKWSGVQANAYAQAGAYRVESSRASTQAGQQSAVDVDTFIAWTDAVASGQEDLADFFFERFRDEFKPAVEAWLATNPIENLDAPATPFVMPEYSLAATAESERLVQLAEEQAEEARDANQRGDNYVAMTVVFAAVLFFLGISTKFEDFGPRAALTGLGVLGMLAGIGILATFPVEV